MSHSIGRMWFVISVPALLGLALFVWILWPNTDPGPPNEGSSSTAPSASTDIPTFRLRAGEPIFWNGEVSLEEGRWEYVLSVEDHADVLRVALDSPPEQQAGYELQLMTPEGGLAGERVGAISQEVIVSDPQPGQWRVVVNKATPIESIFRMRALLQESRSSAGLPNLKAEPPFDFYMKLPGAEGQSCFPYEQEANGASLCLRFSVGPTNWGPGPLLLRFSANGNSSVLQEVRGDDGDSDVTRAGTYRYHSEHGHFHLQDFLRVLLFRLDNGKLVDERRGSKLGFCFHDYAIVDWRKFHSVNEGLPSTECTAEENGRLSLSPGWSEIYPWTTIDNYVDVAGLQDGDYVVRVVIDPQNRLVEADDRDNAAYALIRIRGVQVEIRERGYGEGPSDPRRRLVTSWSESLAN